MEELKPIKIHLDDSDVHTHQLFFENKGLQVYANLVVTRKELYTYIPSDNAIDYDYEYSFEDIVIYYGNMEFHIWDLVENIVIPQLEKLIDFQS